MTTQPHDPYIIWLPRTRKPVARCRLCDWYATQTPFHAAAQHLIHQGEEPCPAPGH